MRIFAGIPLSENITKEIITFQTRNSDLPVRWISPQNLHITIVPPWYEENIDSVVERLSSLSFQEKISFRFDEVTFAPRGKPRLMWAKGKTPLSFISLHKELLHLLDKKPERRPLLLHTTIARFRTEDYYDFPRRELDGRIEWEMEAREVLLYESVLGREGANYFPIARFPISI